MAGLKERFSLRGLLFLMAVIGLACVLVAAASVGFRTAQVSSETDRVVAVYDPAADDVAALSLATSDMQRGLSLFVLTGSEDSLRPYRDGERRSALALSSLDRLVGGEPEIAPLLSGAERARSRWLAAVARPAIRKTRADQQASAERLITGELARTRYDRLVLATDRLGNTINGNRSAGFAELQDLSQRLSNVVAFAMAALLLALLAGGYLLFRWVLRPLNDLRRQIRTVAQRGEHHKPISPTGPTELAAVGRDAEEMRRQLVSEIDEARAARESLEGDRAGAVVAAIRRELSTPTDPSVPGVTVHGEVSSAEGVLAGDWWDCVAMPSGEAALIVTDIAGHGPEAGVAAMRVKHMIAQALVAGAGPAEAITAAAPFFSDELDRFATLAIVCVDPLTGAVRWSNAGHHPALVLSPDGRQQELGPTGPLLSWLGGPWRTGTTTIGPDDVLLAFSDGLVESHDGRREELGSHGLVELYRSAARDGAAPAEVVRRTLALARQRAVDWERDDVTLVALSLSERIDSPHIPGPRPTPAPVR